MVEEAQPHLFCYHAGTTKGGLTGYDSGEGIEQTAARSEEAFQKLEEIVGQLEDGQLGLTESLARYEEGVGFLKQCHHALAAAEEKISLLTALDAEGQAELEPFDEQAMSLDEKQAARSRRRSRQTSAPPPGSGDETDEQRGLF